MSLAVEAKKLLDRAAGIPLLAAIRASRAVLGRRREDRVVAPRRVLFIKLWGVGNLAMVLPLTRAVKRSGEDVTVDFLSLESNRELIEACPWVDRGIYFQHGGVVRPLVSLLRLALRLRRERYDLILDFEQFLKTSVLLTWIARPGHSVGFRTVHQHRHGVHGTDVPHDDARHMALVFGDIVRAAGFDTAGVPPLFAPPAADRVGRVRALLTTLRRQPGPLVVLHIGSGDNFEGRRWPVSHFARLADVLHARVGARILFTGTLSERPLIQRCRERLSAPSIDLTGQLNLTELTELLRRVDLLVSNDTAPVHLASAVGSPLIALYGPNTPRLYGPLSPAASVFHKGLSCSPCITNSNAKTSFCRRPVCLSSIQPSEVTAAALSILRRQPAPIVEPT